MPALSDQGQFLPSSSSSSNCKRQNPDAEPKDPSLQLVLQGEGQISAFEDFLILQAEGAGVGTDSDAVVQTAGTWDVMYLYFTYHLFYFKIYLPILFSFLFPILGLSLHFMKTL